MTNDALLALIKANPSLKALADAGRDNELAAAAVALAPPVPSNYMLTWLEVGKLFGPAAGATMYGGLQAANPFVFQLMQNDGVNVCDPSAAAFIASLVAGNLLTQLQADQITALGSVHDTIPDAQVSQVLAPLRQNVDGAILATPITWN